MQGSDNVDKNTWFNTVGTDIENLTRHTSYHERSKTDMRANFFSDRVVRTWKKLSTETKEAKTLREFTTLLDGVELESF